MPQALVGQNGAVRRLVAELGRLPGIGARSAERLAHHLLKAPTDQAMALAEAIRAAKVEVHHCRVCSQLTEADPPVCAICDDARRDHGVVCVVEQPWDLEALEGVGSYPGVYHVLLGRLAPLQGVGPEHLTIDSLETRVRAGGIRELILATNPNLEGDGTALFIAERLGDTGVSITRLARGLASGGALEFANKEMLADALAGRQRF